MTRKPLTEYRIVCSGKGEPWHMENGNRAHSWPKRSPSHAAADADDLNTSINLGPISTECQPWTIETRTITQWETWTPNSS